MKTPFYQKEDLFLLNWQQGSQTPNCFNSMEINSITKLIIGSPIEVHKRLGPGQSECANVVCRDYELTESGLWVQRQLSPPLFNKEINTGTACLLDWFSRNGVAIEMIGGWGILDLHRNLLIFDVSNAAR